MSLLEDVFLNDEAGEAQELERVIDGDEFDERPRSPLNSDENSEKEDEAVEDKRRVDPDAKAKRVVKNPRFTLNPARLTGPRGIQVIPEHFKDFKFKGKGHEKEDLDMVLKKLEHWAYRLYPKFKFEDCLKKIETLGKKRPVMVHLHKIRSDQLLSEETIVQKDSSDDEALAPVQEEDEFDKLLQQQIELARATPAPGSVKKPGFATPSVDKRSPLTMPKATSSPSISDEQKERMIRNRRLAEERRLARLKQNTSVSLVDKSNPIEEEPIVNDDTGVRTHLAQNTDLVVDITGQDINKSHKDVNSDTVQVRKINRSNVIDSDEESEITGNASNNLVVDMSEQDSNMFPKKADTRRNKSNVFDSDNDSNDSDIDMTEQDSNLSHKKADLKKNKPNVIDSDSESNLVIDMTEQDSNLSPKESNARKNISNASESDNEVNSESNNLVIDITEQDSNTFPTEADTRRNKPNAFDSDSELNTDSNNLVIDMTEHDSKSPKQTSIRRNKSNIFDSDNESNTDFKNLVIDMTEKDSNLIHTKVTKLRSNIMEFKNVSDVTESIDTDNSKNIVIDITEQETVPKNVDKRNVPVDDSSEDEDMTVIQSISVDIHVNGNKYQNANTKDAKTPDSGTNITKIDDSIETVSEMNDGIEKEIIANDRNENGGKNKLENDNIIQGNFIEIGEKNYENKVVIHTVNQNIKEIVSKEVDGNSKILDEKENIDINVLQNDVVDLMDVDFSDDF